MAVASSMYLIPNKQQERTGNDGEGICGRMSATSVLKLFILNDILSRFVTLFWPKKVKASKLEEIHAKMVMKEAAPRAQSDNSALKKPRVGGSSSKTNGTSTVPNTSMRTNGKSYR